MNLKHKETCGAINETCLSEWRDRMLGGKESKHLQITCAMYAALKEKK